MITRAQDIDPEKVLARIDPTNQFMGLQVPQRHHSRFLCIQMTKLTLLAMFPHNDCMEGEGEKVTNRAQVKVVYTFYTSLFA